MTNERAIEILSPEHREHYPSIEPVNEACRMGMEALKYRTPKKPNYPNEYKIRCPICDTPVIDGQLYCDECGQALDWT